MSRIGLTPIPVPDKGANRFREHRRAGRRDRKGVSIGNFQKESM